MLNLFRKKKLANPQLKEALQQGALIIDVRTPAEYDDGHITTATNIPLQQLQTQLTVLTQQKKVFITCCRSGARSNIACQLIKTAGLDCYDGGAWQQLQKQID